MANNTVSAQTEPAQDPRRRGPLAWVVVVVAGLAVIAGVVIALTRTGTNPPAVDPDQPAVVIKLTGPAASGRCMMPTAETLSAKPLAFAGTVQEVEASRVVLIPSTFYAGGPADQVTVAYAGSDRISDGSIDFTVGEQVLIAAENGHVTACGLSGQATDELTALYGEAFGG